MLTVKFRVNSYKRIPSPFDTDKDPTHPQKSFIAICNINDLPNNIPMGTNPRERNFKTEVAKTIEESLYENPRTFHLLNRGIVISAASAEFNNKSNMLTLVFSDLEKHGDIDGGHTYQIILNNRDKINEEVFVRLEIMTGVDDFFEELADARNKSNQVEDKSLAELAKKFDFIKEAIASEPYKDDIRYKENAKGNIDITDIVAMLTMFNLDRYPITDTSQTLPVVSYSQKKKCVDYYLEDYEKSDNPYKKMVNIMVQVFKLYSHIEEQFPQVYNRDGGRKYGSIKGVIYKKDEAFYVPKFLPNDDPIKYETPRGFIYPVLAAFRAMLEEDKATGCYKWLFDSDPIAIFDEIAPKMVDATVERSRTLGNNPQSVGKDSNHWAQMFGIVHTKCLELKIANMQAQG